MRPLASRQQPVAGTNVEECGCSLCSSGESNSAGFDSPEWEAERGRYIADFDSKILSEGYVLQYVWGDAPEPSWAYTVGRMRAGFPELLVVGLDPSSAQGLIDHVSANWADIAAGVQAPGWGDVRLLPIPRSVMASTDYLLGAESYAARAGLRAPTAQQIIWSDPAGFFPWDAECDPRLRRMQVIVGFGERSW
jgi:Domain of unknown function (DUF4262)